MNDSTQSALELISIIIPVYNVEQYLNQCLESVMQQSYSNLEIILVNDGSTDGSGEICDYYRSFDPRIKVIHQKNAGLSEARNSGLRIANGEWIAFVDSDDWIDKDYIFKLFKVADKNAVDIVVCNYFIAEGDSIAPILGINRLYTNEKDIMTDYFGRNSMRTVVWNKLYQRRIFENLSFREQKTHEDEFFTYLALHKAKKVMLINDPLYYYRQRADSIMGSKVSEKNLNCLEAELEKIDFVKQQYPELLVQVKCGTLGKIVYYYQLALKEGRRKTKDLRQMLKSYQQQIKFEKIEIQNLDNKQKLRIFLSSVFLREYALIRNVLKKM